MSLVKVISGGQSGVDSAALEAAKFLGIPTGGWMPKGFLTEDGPRPEYAELYGMQETPTTYYSTRTRKNIAAAGATLILVDREADLLRGGTYLTMRLCKEALEANGHDLCAILLGHHNARQNALRFLRDIASDAVSVLNVAGPRESKCPGVGARAKAFLVDVFQAAKE